MGDTKYLKQCKQGDLVKRGWAAVHSTAEHWSIFESIELHCTFLI